MSPRRSHLPPASAIASAPEEAFLAFMCVLAALPLLFGQSDAPSMQALLPTWLVKAWALELLIGGGSVMLGMAIRRIGIEQAGLVILSFACPAYAVALVGFAGLAKSSVSVLMLLAYGAACVRRAWLIKQSRDVQILLAAAAADADMEIARGDDAR